MNEYIVKMLKYTAISLREFEGTGVADEAVYAEAALRELGIEITPADRSQYSRDWLATWDEAGRHPARSNDNATS